MGPVYQLCKDGCDQKMAQQITPALQEVFRPVSIKAHTNCKGTARLVALHVERPVLETVQTAADEKDGTTQYVTEWR